MIANKKQETTLEYFLSTHFHAGVSTARESITASLNNPNFPNRAEEFNSDKVGKFVGGLNPAGDVRDIVANGKKVIQGDGKATIPLIASVVGGVPGFGDVAKPIIKEVGEELTERVLREGGDELLEKTTKEAAEKLAKEQAEQIAKQYGEIAKSGHVVQRHGEDITERQLDDRAINGIDPASGNTFDAYKKLPDGTPAPHKYSKDATKFVSKNALVKTENYIKNSRQFEDAVKLGTPEIKIEGLKLEDIFGAEYRKEVFGKTRIGTKNNPIGTRETDFTDGTVKAIFKKDAEGKWKLETMFPEPKN